MKCSKCNKTWSLFDEKLSDKQHCPHCKEKKFISKFQYFDSVSEGIAYCLEMGGKEILKNKSKMNAYINDLMGNDFPDHNLVKKRHRQRHWFDSDRCRRKGRKKQNRLPYSRPLAD